MYHTRVDTVTHGSCCSSLKSVTTISPASARYIQRPRSKFGAPNASSVITLLSFAVALEVAPTMLRRRRTPKPLKDFVTGGLMMPMIHLSEGRVEHLAVYSSCCWRSEYVGYPSSKDRGKCAVVDSTCYRLMISSPLFVAVLCQGRIIQLRHSGWLQRTRQDCVLLANLPVGTP